MLVIFNIEYRKLLTYLNDQTKCPMFLPDKYIFLEEVNVKIQFEHNSHISCLHMQKVAHQKNGTDCGVFVCKVSIDNYMQPIIEAHESLIQLT